jgi:hypothetical protein
MLIFLAKKLFDQKPLKIGRNLQISFRATSLPYSVMTFEPLSSSLTAGNAAFMVEKVGTFLNQQRHRTLLAI